MEQVKFVLDLPESVLDRIRNTVSDTIEKALAANIKSIHARPRLLTRAEAAEKLRISFPTLKTYEEQGFLKAERIGRRVLFREDLIEAYLSSSSLD